MIADEAMGLAAAGWKVFPLAGKVPAIKGGRGHLDATDDAEQVRRWWHTMPTANIGARVHEHLVVLDVDPRSGGLDGLSALGELPVTLTVWSGRRDGGRHLYFRRPPGPLTSTGLPEGIDLKTPTGYCVVPPSIHPATGHPYEWADPEAPIVCLPPAVTARLRPIRRARPGTGATSAPAGLVAFVARQPEGNRNAGLFWAACRAAETDQLDQLADALVTAAVYAGEDARSARRTVESAARTSA